MALAHDVIRNLLAFREGKHEDYATLGSLDVARASDLNESHVAAIFWLFTRGYIDGMVNDRGDRFVLRLDPERLGSAIEFLAEACGE